MKYFQNKHSACLFVCVFTFLFLKINQMRFSKGCIFKQSYTVFPVFILLGQKKNLQFLQRN